MKRVLCSVLVLWLLFVFTDVAEAKKKKKKPKRVPAEATRTVPFDPTREAVYVRNELLALFWKLEIEPMLQRDVYGITPYVGLNAWIAHKVATSCAPCELPPQAKMKYCNHWIEDQLADEKRRLFRIPPDGWCYPLKRKEG